MWPFQKSYSTEEVVKNTLNKSLQWEKKNLVISGGFKLKNNAFVDASKLYFSFLLESVIVPMS